MMEQISPSLTIVLLLTFGFALAALFGYITLRAKLSPILGYLFAGYLIGPYSPGFVADVELSEQLAEIGVVLMMFGVGLHFKWQDLVKVRHIAIPGAVGQTAITTLVAAWLMVEFGWSVQIGIIMGLCIGVASTVVLVRILSDNQLLKTPQGHIAVGWLVVEDILTVAALLAVPIIAASHDGQSLSWVDLSSTFLQMFLKFGFLILFMFLIGQKIVGFILFQVARTRSTELFTITILALAFLMATSSAVVFGTSLALGAFIAGIVIGQTHVRHQAYSQALPIQDAFFVIFFLSVGMLFNPEAIWLHPILFIAILSIILIVKPLAAFLITYYMHYPAKLAITVAFALAQIGEFSFILSEEAMKYKIFPEEGYDILVACAFISIALNPPLFRWLDYFFHYTQEEKDLSSLQAPRRESPHALVIGYGPIGKKVTQTLDKLGFIPIIIDLNVDSINHLIEEERQAIFGDAKQIDILTAAHIQSASLLLITIPEAGEADQIIKAAHHLNSSLAIIARIRFLHEKPLLLKKGVEIICSEEESMHAFDRAVIKLSKKIVY